MTEIDNMLALRMDDVGACSKRYEVYSDRGWKLGPLRVSGNWLFLKYLPSMKKWGPYREMTAQEWLSVYKVLEARGAGMTVAVTACWAEGRSSLVPFHRKFPDEAAVLREGLSQGLIEIANHGLTHCVLESNRFKPRWFSGNRKFHREFWDWVPASVQERHIARSQEILHRWFETDIVTFVPPGNVFTQKTLKLAGRYGLRYVSCSSDDQACNGVRLISDRHVLPFHDRDIVLKGYIWLEEHLARLGPKKFCTIKELGERCEAAAGSASS